MRILRVSVKNFGSYPTLEMDLESGLSLIYGPTGSGKSTVMDAVCWCLFGVTAKDGAADDVRSWNATEPTTGVIWVEHNGWEYRIYRSRGKQSENDLSLDGTRGTNIVETQKIINTTLGTDSDTFISSAYFNEFSPTGSFFLAKAKDRRELFEKIADLSMPNTLAEAVSEKKSAMKKQIKDAEETYVRAKSKEDNTTWTVRSIVTSQKTWQFEQDKLVATLMRQESEYEAKKQEEIESLKARANAFEFTQAQKLDALYVELDNIMAALKSDSEINDRLGEVKNKLDRHKDQVCSTCGQNVSHGHEDLHKEMQKLRDEKSENTILGYRRESVLQKIKSIESESNTFEVQAQAMLISPNPYTVSLEAEKAKVNPFIEKLEQFNTVLEKCVQEAAQAYSSLAALKADLGRLDHLSVLCTTFRAELLKLAINSIQEETNEYLERYFDSEFRIEFSLDGDKLDVAVNKSGNQCSFKQLSKGQRQLLKLSFALACMHGVSNRSGVKFENLFFDEALDGLDENLKVKAFALFEALEPSFHSIFLIDHSTAFQNMFTKKYAVKIEGDKSTIEPTNV